MQPPFNVLYARRERAATIYWASIWAHVHTVYLAQGWIDTQSRPVASPIFIS